MKVTLDSGEPLDDALRVVGALYGVTLTVVDNNQPDESNKATSRTSARTRKSAPARKTKTSAARATVASRNRTSAQRGPGSRSTNSPKASGNAEIRSWAQANGMRVNSRGRIPATVLAAYHDAHLKST